jgi:hypothetical protein
MGFDIEETSYSTGITFAQGRKDYFDADEIRSGTGAEVA